MRRAAVAIAVAGLAAAGAASVDEQPSRAALLRDESAAATKCAPRQHFGQVLRHEPQLFVRGKSVPKAFVKEGDWLRIEASGYAELCLRRGSTTCFVHGGSRLRVGRGTRVHRRPNTLLYVPGSQDGVFCETSSGGEKWIETDHGSVKVVDPVFSVKVGKKRTVVKVRRGAAVVEGRRGTGAAVVLGRKQQVVVPAGRDPLAPTGIEVTRAERQAFRRVERSASKDTDKQGPGVDVQGPRLESSLRTAAFTFTATESGSTFSCALDGSDLRLCTSPQELRQLAPGVHRFTVRATDMSGNPSTVSYTWTVDGSLIAFTSDRSGNADVFVMDPHGGGQVALTSDGATDEDPEWSPDARRIAFDSDRTGNFEIFVMNADGTDARQVTTDPARDWNATWSPDGSKLAFQRGPPGRRDIWVVNVDGTGATPLVKDVADDADPAWSPDGTRIAFASDRDGDLEIYVTNADGSGVATRLTDNAVEDLNPAWSPDGSRVAFHSRRSLRDNIWLMNADGSGVLMLTDSPFYDRNPAWSADGEWIVFQSTHATDPRTQIFVVKADGSRVATRVTVDAANDFVPDWSPAVFR